MNFLPAPCERRTAQAIWFYFCYLLLMYSETMRIHSS